MTPKKLLVHIGPPKTATTSFQSWLRINQNTYTYIGVIQPRKPEENKLYSFFWLFINGKLSTDKLFEYLTEYNLKDILILSEEMILTNNWEYKLNRLAKLKKYFELHLAYSYRPTNKAIPSYYAEIHANLPETLKNNYDLFLQDDRVKAYDLKQVFELSSNNQMQLNIFKFNDLIKGSITLNNVFNTSFLGEDFNKDIKLSKENTRKNKSKNIYQVIDKKPKYPTKLKPFLIKIEKMFNVSFKKVFQKNYQIKIDVSDEVNELSKKNESFFNKYIYAK